MGGKLNGFINNPCPAGAVVQSPVFGTTNCTNPFPPSNLTASPSSGCAPYNTNLSGTCSAGTLRWYTNALGTGAGIGNTHTINMDSTFYARCYDASKPTSCQYSASRSIMVTTSNGVYDTIKDTLCMGQSLNFGGNTYNSTGLYNDTIPLGGGCDSIITLDLFVVPTLQINISDSICDGDLYNFNGNILNTAGTFRDTSNSVYGCDSITILTLTVLPIYRDTIHESICTGEMYLFNGYTYGISGYFQANFYSNYNCDSIVVLDLTVIDIIRDTINEDICYGETYNFGGTILSSSGTYNDTLVNGNGCDSISTINLTVNSLITDTVSATICDGNSYAFGGNNYTNTGLYNDTLQATNTCDSIVTLNLIVNSVYYDTIQRAICDGDVYLFGGNAYAVAGNYNDTLNTSFGCDSIATLQLTVNPSPSTTIFDTICEGYLYNFEGKNIGVGGIYFDTLTTTVGCDSALILNLHVIPTVRDTISTEICDGNFVLFDGVPRNIDGIYTATYTLANGCDSTSTLILSINPNPVVSIIGDSILCNNTLGLLSSSGNFTSYLWSTGETTPSINFYSELEYKLTVTDDNNCTGADSLFVDVINCEDTCQIYVPNAFTPDNDGFNDIFKAIANDECIFSEFKLLIFNRWGQLLKEVTDIDQTWDGTYKGLKSQIDTYIWVLTYKKNKEVNFIRKFGHVSIIK